MSMLNLQQFLMHPKAFLTHFPKLIVIDMLSRNPHHRLFILKPDPSHKIWVAGFSRMLWACLMCVQAVFGQPVHGTTLVLVIRDTVAYFGADSRGISDQDEVVDTICKIAVCGKRVVGIKGIGVFGEPVEEASKTLMRSMRMFPREGIYQSVRRLDSTWSKSLLMLHREHRFPARLIRIGFFGCEYFEENFKVIYVEYSLDTSGGNARVRSPHVEQDYYSRGLFVMGTRDSILSILRTDTTSFIRANPITVINSVIGVESTKSRRLVSGPIDIVGMKRDSVWWVQRKKQCKPCGEE
jgi:hypothetical protein